MAVRHVAAIPDESAIDLNAAIAATESEVFTEALGDDPLDNDGDRSLEEMGEGLEGDELEEDEAEGEGDEAEAEGDEDAEGDEGEEEEGDEEGEGEGEGEDADADDRVAARGETQREEDRRGVPAFRVREETERRRTAEAERDAARAELATINAKLDGVMARLSGPAGAASGQPGTQQPGGAQASPTGAPAAAPDMFADPEGYQRWVEARIEAKAQEIARATFNANMQEITNNRVNQNLHSAATGDRGWEFQAAYQALTTGLNPQNPAHRQIVQGIYNSPDPAAALFQWWDQNGGAEFREQVYSRLSQDFEPQPQRQPRGQRNGGGNPRGGRGDNEQSQGRARVEFQGPRTVRTGPPSLNGMAGSGSQRVTDPDLLDPSEGSIMDYALRR